MLVMLSIPLIAVINKRKLASHSQTFTVIVLRVWFRLSRRVLYEVWVCYSSVPGGSPPRRPIGSCLIWPWYASVSCECAYHLQRLQIWSLLLLRLTWLSVTRSMRHIQLLPRTTVLSILSLNHKVWKFWALSFAVISTFPQCVEDSRVWCAKSTCLEDSQGSYLLWKHCHLTRLNHLACSVAPTLLPPEDEIHDTFFYSWFGNRNWG
jgi:hypothetical protein